MPQISEIIFHLEATSKPEDVIRTIKRGNKLAGLALNPDTTIEGHYSLLEKVDLVQFMTVHPGQYGAEFVEGVLEKISSFHSQYPNVKIIVDGAMHSETYRKVIAVGASGIVVGGHIFSEGRDIGEAINELKSLSAY